jgi:hypothetical protein
MTRSYSGSGGLWFPAKLFSFVFRETKTKQVSLFREINWPFREISILSKISIFACFVFKFTKRNILFRISSRDNLPIIKWKSSFISNCVEEAHNFDAAPGRGSGSFRIAYIVQNLKMYTVHCDAAPEPALDPAQANKWCGSCISGPADFN